MNAARLSGFRGLTARLVLVAFAPFALDGCLSIGVRSSSLPPGAASPGTGSFEGRLYETPSAAKKDERSPRPVTWKLIPADRSSEAPVREGTGNAWTATEIPPGEYRLAVSWGKIPGVEGSSTGHGSYTFSISAGETAQAQVVLKKTPVGLLIVLGIVVVLAIVAVATFDLDLFKGGSGLSFRDRSPTVVGPSGGPQSPERHPGPAEGVD